MKISDSVEFYVSVSPYKKHSGSHITDIANGSFDFLMTKYSEETVANENSHL